MPYKLIKGQFHLFYKGKKKVGSRPDGDSVWFKPDIPGHLNDVAGRSAKLNKGGMAQLRFEAIDALETHFQSVHQNLDYGFAARDFTLSGLGFNIDTVKYSGKKEMTVASATPHPTTGYILTRSIDPYGRPVSFVFSGNTSYADGKDDVFLNVTMLKKSVNAELAVSGNAFPTFYTGLPTDLRNHIKSVAESARTNKEGLWKDDKSMKGAKAGSQSYLETEVLFPKLFRRLTSYYKDGNDGLSNFGNWLREKEDRDDKLWIVSKGEEANMHDVIKISGNKISMQYLPEDIIVVPR